MMYYSRLDLSSIGQATHTAYYLALHHDAQAAGEMICLGHLSPKKCQPVATGDDRYADCYFLHKVGVVFDSKLTYMLVAVTPAIP